MTHDPPTDHMWGLVVQIKELQEEVGRLRGLGGKQMSREKQLELMVAEIKAAVFPQLVTDWLVKEIATHLLDCGWTKHTS